MKKILLRTLAATPVLLSIVYAATHDFVPTTVFKGSALTGWHKLGAAEWTANNGEITGTPKAAEGGWLILDKGYQDTQFYTEFRCAAACNAGLLFRAQKTADGGLRGVYISLSDNDLNSYDVTLSPEGKELSRTRLERATAQFARMAAGPWANGSARVPGFANPGPTLAEEKAQAAKPAAPTPAAAAAPAAGRGGFPSPQLQANDWNTEERW